MNLLTIGGSDTSSGAGIQGDIKTFAAHGAYGLTVITAITSQNTTSFMGAEAVSLDMLKLQLDAIASDFDLAGIKIGMVYTADVIKIIVDWLGHLARSVPIVLDPVIRSTTGGTLLDESALSDYVRCVLPISTAVTPNVYEARTLLGAVADTAIDHKTAYTARSMTDPEGLALGLVDAGTDCAIVTGIDVSDNTISDVVATRENVHRLSGSVIPGITHGGGCAFSAALLCGLAGGRSFLESAGMARRFVTYRMANPRMAGSGIGIVDDACCDMSGADQLYVDLADAIGRFSRTRAIYRHIPECQTNFVYSKPQPRTVCDVLGVMGRIVRTGRSVVMAGELRYGGSKHVATALLAASGRFPEIRSAINIRYDADTLQAMHDAKMHVLLYDRRLEPRETKSAGSTVWWGVSESIKHADSEPDAVCHDGDYGKEPMIILFGNSPADVLLKIEKILDCKNSDN